MHKTDLLGFIILFPLLGAVINGLFGHKLKEKTVCIIGSSSIFLSFVFSLIVLCRLVIFPEKPLVDRIFTWIEILPFTVPFTLLADTLSITMTLLVTFVGFLIHLYSVGYMHGEKSIGRYFAYLNLFIFSMLILVLSKNLLMLFIGWEGVGLCSYLLIGFWYESDYNAYAGRKAFIVNRIGDFGFLAGILLLIYVYGFKNGIWSLDYLNLEGYFYLVKDHLTFNFHTITIIAFLLFIGAAGKSAQIPLYVWLPDAMAGPTPVSALIHAATMVTAGVFMIGRLSFLFVNATTAVNFIAIIGGLTAFFAATIALTQNDIKKVLAYSTISQLGFMFVAMGIRSFSTGIFHILTHGFFKALLFLGAGSVIHALLNEQDIRKMGGLRSKLPWTYRTFLVGTLAISGFPLLAGFFSKDEILWNLFASGHKFLWILSTLTAIMTAAYMTRLLYLVFYGSYRGDTRTLAHGHESPNVMVVPLLILSIFSLLFGFIGFPGHSIIADFLKNSLYEFEYEGSHALEYFLAAFSGILSVTTITITIYIYKRTKIPQMLAEKAGSLYNLSLNKYYVDELYDRFIIIPIKNGSKILFKAIDLGVIEAILNGIARKCMEFSRRLAFSQDGVVHSYALSIFVGLFLMVLYILFII